jgi:heme oxygenase
MTSVSTLMRECSMQDHQAAENVHFITHLMKGELSKAHYVEYLGQLAHVYRALERKLPDGTALPFHVGLKRFDRILLDLENLGVFDFDARPVLATTVEYVSHLDSLGGVEDVRLIAHH